uniref:Choline O-acetyltransferase n=1 Tax=Strongyloides stercoralis TaxID=6248 RepID=A0A0K0EGA2_STRER
MDSHNITNINYDENSSEKTKKLYCVKLYNWNEPPLPKPPVPSLEHSFKRYLEYASVICDNQSDLNFEQTKAAVKEFFPNAVELQKKLLFLAEKSDNWINKFWLPEMYLRPRYPLPLYSNPAYIFPQQKFNSTDEQLNFAAWLIRGFVEYKLMIDNQQFPREISAGVEKIPVCMEQYKRILSCYREPNYDCDNFYYKRENPSYYDEDGNDHIVVMCHNQAFVLYTKINNELLPHSEILYQLKKIVNYSQNRPTATPIGVITAGNRDKAAQIWENLKKKPINNRSLEWIKSATFILCLDFIKHLKSNINIDNYEDYLAHRGHHILHGFGSTGVGLNRWYNSTIQIVVSDTGTNGLLIEHSVAEGIVIINMAEYVQKYVEKNINRLNIVSPKHMYDPKPLTWSIDGETANLMISCQKEFNKLSDGLELNVLYFDEYGKEFIKSKNVSPDGFCQLIMQLAHYIAHGKLVSTYESASIRRFKYGRVDNIRAATPEVLKWVKSMTSSFNEYTDNDRRDLFYNAAKKQALITKENIHGEGIDNHLCALNVLARDNLSHIPKIFEEKTWTETMRFPLSTSQVTTVQIPNDTYLCYGAVVDDGYGCSYNLQKNFIVFAPSCYKFNDRTNGKIFKKCLKDSLRIVGNLLNN